jgi:hypothetical protein
MTLGTRALYLSSSLLLGAAISLAQTTPGASPDMSGSSQDQDSSMAGQTSGAQLRGCLSGSPDNYSLTDHNGAIYHLVGASADLQNAVGHEVEISGAPDSRRTSVPDSTAANTASSFQVITVRDVANQCERGGVSSSGPSGAATRDHDSQPMSEAPPTIDSHPKGSTGEATPPHPELIAMWQQPGSADSGSSAAQNSNNSSAMSSTASGAGQASQDVNSAPQQPISNDANLPAQGRSGAHQTETNTNSTNSPYQNTPVGGAAQANGGQGSTPSAGAGNGNTGAPSPVTNQTPAAAQSPTNPNSQLGSSSANQSGNASQPPQSAAPASNSPSPQAQDDPNKPLYERPATDVPWANRSGSAATTTPH